jgi:hypothetical protein
MNFYGKFRAILQQDNPHKNSDYSDCQDFTAKSGEGSLTMLNQ